MKKFMIFLTALAAIYPTYSQVTTKTKNDSLVCIPKTIANQIASDLEKKKQCENLVTTLENHVSMLETKTGIQDTIISKQGKQIELYKTNEGRFDAIIVEKDKQISGLKKDSLYKKLVLGTTTAITGFVVGVMFQIFL